MVTSSSSKTAVASISSRTKVIYFVAAANYLARFGSALILLVTIPIIRNYLGSDRFGVWMMVSSLIGFMAFADLGLGNGALQRLTAAYAKNDKNEVARVFSSTFVCMTCIGVAIISLWLIWSAVAVEPQNLIGKIKPEYAKEALLAFSAFFILFSINLPLGLIQKAQLAMQKGYIGSLWGCASSLLTVLAIPISIHFDLGLVALVLSSLGMTVLANAANMFFWLNSSGTLFSLRWCYVHRTSIFDVLKLGLMFFTLQLAVAFAYQSDAVVISQTLGVDAYGDYAAIQRIFMTASVLIGAALGGLWPAFGNAIAQDDIAWVKRALRNSFFAAGLTACLVIGLIELFIWPITSFWLGITEPPEDLLCWGLGAWAIIEVLGSISGSFMNGAGALRAQLVIALLMAGAAFAGKWLLIPRIGVAGAAISTLVAYLVISVPWQIRIYIQFFLRGKAAS